MSPNPDPGRPDGGAPDAGSEHTGDRPQSVRGVYLALGSNLGDRLGHLRAGLVGLARRGARPVTCSPVYRTAPVGGPPQGDFLNLVLEVETALHPWALLQAALETEASAGRDRSPAEPGRPPVRWGPRSLDVDVLLYQARILEAKDLQIPHPRLHLRRFVLVPLADLAAGRLHPVARRTIGDLLAGCADRSAVVRQGPPLPLP